MRCFSREQRSLFFQTDEKMIGSNDPVLTQSAAISPPRARNAQRPTTLTFGTARCAEPISGAGRRYVIGMPSGPLHPQVVTVILHSLDNSLINWTIGWECMGTGDIPNAYPKTAVCRGGTRREARAGWWAAPYKAGKRDFLIIYKSSLTSSNSHYRYSVSLLPQELQLCSCSMQLLKC